MIKSEREKWNYKNGQRAHVKIYQWDWSKQAERTAAGKNLILYDNEIYLNRN